MKYLSNRRNACEDTSYEETAVCFLHAGFFIRDTVCESDYEAIYSRTRNIQRLFFKTVSVSLDCGRGIHMVSDQDSGRSVSHPAGIGIHKNAESGIHSISGMDGLFKRHAPVNGSSEHGNQGKYPLYRRNPPPVPSLCSSIHGHHLVQLYLSPKQMEYTEKYISGTHHAGGDHTRSIRKSYTYAGVSGEFVGGGAPREPDIGAAGNGLWLQAGVE